MVRPATTQYLQARTEAAEASAVLTAHHLEPVEVVSEERVEVVQVDLSG